MRFACALLVATVLTPAAWSDVAALRPLDIAELNLPPGFQISIYAQGLGNSRMLAFSPTGILFVSDFAGGRILSIPWAGRVETFASGLNLPHGLAFRGNDLYVAENHRIAVFPNATGGVPQMVAPLPPSSPEAHKTRTILWDSAGKLVATVGSTCNLCNESDPRYAAALRFNPDGSGMEIFARGLRNAVGMAVHPVTGEIWATDNGADGLGDDVPPEEINILRAGSDYGWPRCYGNGGHYPGYSGDCSATVPPVLAMQAHSAPLGISFYTGAMFPPAYRNDAFVAFHGSWNRSTPTGYKVVRVFASGGHVAGMEDFLTGFLRGNTTSGRPVHAVTGPDGALYVSDDVNGVVYRISYSGPSATPLLNVSAGALTFNFQVGATPPPSQSVILTSTGAPVSFTVTPATTSGGNWLSVTPQSGTTPATVFVGVNPGSLPIGTYTGSVTLTAPGAANSPQVLPVTFIVSSAPVNPGMLFVSAASMAFTAPANGPATTIQTASITSNTSGAPLNFTVSITASPGGNWLQVSPVNATTPSNLNIWTNPVGLPAGTYSGLVIISAPAAQNSPQTIAVTLTVTPSVTVSVNPASLYFRQTATGASPVPQTLSVSSSVGALTFSATATTNTGGGWLWVSPGSSTTPATLMVWTDVTGLQPGTYTGSITIWWAASSLQTVPVTLTVSGPPALFISPGGLSFSFEMGSGMPAAQTLSVLAGNGTTLPFVAWTSTTSGGNWLSVGPPVGTTPATLGVFANPTGLAPGAYSGTVTITAGGASNSPQLVNVSLAVTAAPPPPPVLNAVMNAASFVTGAIAPGQIITLFGSGIGPATPATLRLTASGLVDTVLADTRVWFDGIAAPMIYASSTEVSAVVPYQIGTAPTTRLQIEFQGVRTAAIDLLVADSAPAIFTADSTGSGQGAIVNQNLVVNSAANPAPRGSVVMIYGTGEGRTSPPGIDGMITYETLRKPVLPVSVIIGGQRAEVLYAGSAPGLVAGVLQVNARVPTGIPPGPAVPVVLIIGNTSSPPVVTMAVQ